MREKNSIGDKEKQNCWEFFKCQKSEHCNAVNDINFNGINNGINGGRFCWIAANHLSHGEIKPELKKLENCLECQFYKKVRKEEGEKFKWVFFAD